MAQDFHFSQFNYAPFNINPGNIGHFDGKYRVHLNARDQWRSVSSPYKTYGVAVDFDSLSTLPISPMIGIVSDKAGDANYGLTQINIGLSYRIRITKHLFSPGFQMALNSNNFNLSDLVFDKNGSNSGVNNTQVNFFKFHLGGTWTYYKSRKLIIHNGISFFNLNKDDVATIGNFENKYRINVHGEVLIGKRNFTQFIPSYMISYHGNEKNIIIGSEVKIPTRARVDQLKAIHFSAFTRIGDALILEGGLNYKKVRYGLSYDINLSPLHVASNTIGGIELSIRFIQLYQSKPAPFFRKCVHYM